MIYRFQFDFHVSEILKRCGITTSNQMLEFWPAGATEHLVGVGKRCHAKPVAAAAIGVELIVRQKVEQGAASIEDAEYMIAHASAYAESKGENVLEIFGKMFPDADIYPHEDEMPAGFIDPPTPYFPSSEHRAYVTWLTALPAGSWRDRELEQARTWIAMAESHESDHEATTAIELFEIFNRSLTRLVETDDAVFRFHVRNLFNPIDFASYRVTLESVASEIEQHIVGLRLKTNHWNSEFGNEGLTLVLSYLIRLGAAAAKLGNVLRSLERKSKGQPYSVQQYWTELAEYHQLVDAYTSLGDEMNELSRRIIYLHSMTAPVTSR